ncbi:MAG: type IV secretion system protein, partial [Methylotenera sp.]
ILNNGYGNSNAIRAASRLTSFADLGLDPNSEAGKAFEATGRQAAINRATYEEAYRKAGQRFDDLQVLLDRVNAAPDAKDIADLQARIQAEQVMQQNENTKLAMLANLSKAQQDLALQQDREIRMRKSKSVLGNN